MKLLLKEIQHNKLLWLLAFVPVVFAAEKLEHDAHTLLFVLSVLAIVPLAAVARLEPVAPKRLGAWARTEPAPVGAQRCRHLTRPALH
jgi:hypothetical protein